MPRATRSLVHAFAIAVAGGLLGASAAGAAGGTAATFDTTRTGIEDPISGNRFYALNSRGQTELLKVSAEPDLDGLTLDAMRLPGSFGVPAVAFDGSTSGLSADGKTLVLDERTGSPEQTRMLAIGTGRLERAEPIQLEGDFTFDAISPDGTTVYLIHYLTPGDPTRYEVRAYDLDRGRLLAEPIIDRRTAPEVMRGYPITRAVSPDGAWAYTLYNGGGGRTAVPFVHALDTSEGTALCIDLEMLGGNGTDLYKLDLAPSSDGETIDVVTRGDVPLATIDTETWSAVTPDEVASAEPSIDDDGGPSLALWLAPLAAALLGGDLLLRARRRRAAATVELPEDPFASSDAGGEERRPATRR